MFLSKPFHSIDLIIFFPAVIPADQQLGGCFLLVKSYPLLKPVMQHRAGRTVGFQAASQYQNTVYFFQLCRLFLGKDSVLHGGLHIGIHTKNSPDPRRKKQNQTEKEPPNQ